MLSQTDTLILTLKSIPFWSYIKAHPGPFRPGDMHDLSSLKYKAHYGLYGVKYIRQLYVV